MITKLITTIISGGATYVTKIEYSNYNEAVKEATEIIRKSCAEVIMNDNVKDLSCHIPTPDNLCWYLSYNSIDPLNKNIITNIKIELEREENNNDKTEKYYRTC